MRTCLVPSTGSRAVRVRRWPGLRVRPVTAPVSTAGSPAAISIIQAIDPASFPGGLDHRSSLLPERRVGAPCPGLFWRFKLVFQPVEDPGGLTWRPSTIAGD